MGERPAILLLHGLGATGAVWHGVAEALASAGFADVRAPDLPGHGAAAPPNAYTVDRLAAAVAPAEVSPVVVGHSLGGYVALALASGRYGSRPRAVLSIGAKLSFSAEDLARGRDLAARPVRAFATAAVAADRYRKVAGLAEAARAGDEYLRRGVVGPTAPDGGYRLAMDPAAFAIVVPPFATLLADCRCPVTVARGEHDAMVADDGIAALGRPPLRLEGLGHNAHVDDPPRIAALIASLAAGA